MRSLKVPPVLIRGGTVVDALGSRRADLVLQEGVISSVGTKVSAAPPGTVVLDASGCLVAPGLVDLHTHLRQPGGEDAETVQSASRAAALGGYTAVVAMPNTDPPADCAAVVRFVRSLAAEALVEVQPAGTLTLGRQGQRLAPMAELAQAGVRIFTDDGAGVQDPRLMRRAMQYARALGVVVAEHCEDAHLAAGGQMHEGEWSSKLGLAGQPAEAEELMVMRDLALARLTGARLHLLHLSTAGSLSMVRAAKASGLLVSAEVTPHHFTLTDAALAGYDPLFKVNPPLRTQADLEAVKAALGDGTADAIATDHAPHSAQSKQLPFDQAPPGMVGLETALALALSETGLDPKDVIGLMSYKPAAIAGLEATQGGPIQVGRPANICVVDPERTWVVEPDRLASLSKNTPYGGKKLKGKVRHTIFWGEPVVIDEEAQR